MKKIAIVTACALSIAGTAFSQAQTPAPAAAPAPAQAPSQGPVQQLDQTVRNVAAEVHAKLVANKTRRVGMGQFTFNDGASPLGSYWATQLTDELMKMSGRRYEIIPGRTSGVQVVISGEISSLADVVRVHTRLRRPNGAITDSFNSDFQGNPHVRNMLGAPAAAATGEGGSSSSPAHDAHEPDSWENPVTVTVGQNQSVPVLNRTLTEGDEDFFLVVADRDGRLTVETTGGIDTYMTLFDAETRNKLAENDDGGQGSNARISYRARAGARFIAVVRGYDEGTTGSYGFRAYTTVRAAREGASSWESPITYEVKDGGMDSAVSVQRTLQADDEDYFLIVPRKSGRLTIETTGRIDTYMELFSTDNARTMLAEDDDGGQGSNARIRLDVTAGTRYMAIVRGLNSRVTGSYGFRAYFPAEPVRDQYEPDDEPSQAKTIRLGESQTRSFHSSDDVDWAKFEVAREGVYIITARGVRTNRLDTYLELFNSNMNSIAEDDDGGEGLDARISLNLRPGTYYIKVSCLDDEPDQLYNLKVEAQQ